VIEIFVFGHSKCQPCYYLKRQLDFKKIKYRYVDVEKENPNNWLVNSVPTVIILENGNIKEFLVGYSKKVLETIEKYWREYGLL